MSAVKTGAPFGVSPRYIFLDWSIRPWPLPGNLEAVMIRTRHVEDFMSNVIFVFCLLSIAFTIFLLFSSPVPASTAELNDMPIPGQHRPAIYKGRHAISTFPASKSTEKADQDNNEDGYFMSARTLTYQLLHSPTTTLQTPVPVVVRLRGHAVETLKSFSVFSESPRSRKSRR